MAGGGGDPGENALKLAYEDAVRERNRLRDARGSVTAKLGPLPASAGIIVGLLTSLGSGHPRGLVITALALFVALVLASMWFSTMKPYRKIRAEHSSELPSNTATKSEWLTTMLALEKIIYAELENAFDRERWGLFVVQTLLVLIVLCGGLVQLL